MKVPICPSLNPSGLVGLAGLSTFFFKDPCDTDGEGARPDSETRWSVRRCVDKDVLRWFREKGARRLTEHPGPG